MNELKLEVGKRYRSRNGETVEVREVWSGDDEYFAFRGELTGVGTIQWSADGRYWKYGEDEWDLVEEVPAHPDGEPVRVITDEQADAPLAADQAAYPGPVSVVQDSMDRALYQMREQEVHIDHLKMGRSVRFANYARGILFVLLGVAAMTFATRATARELLSLPNNAGGEIILTDTQSEHCDGSARIAIARSASGKTIAGCWVYSDAGYVYVKWGNDLRLYKLTDFRIIEQDEQPAPLTDHRIPWRGA